MIIKGLQKLTLLDFPEKMACTVFTYGCNFRCPFCHNASLVLSDRAFEECIDEEEFFAFLEARKGRLEGVCVTGGEPTLMPDLEEFIRRIKNLGFAVKLDTNGYRPQVLRSLIEKGLLDYVAMDIKNSPDSYGKTVGIENFDVSPILESAALLMEGKVPFEFRTTVVRQLHTSEDFEKIGLWLKGSEKYFLQGFEDSGDLICDGLDGYDKNELTDLLNVLKRNIPNAQIRG